MHQKNFLQAESEYRQAIEVFKKPDAPLRLDAVAGLCRAQARSGRPTLAFETFRKYINAAAKAIGDEPDEHLAHAYVTLGGLFHEFGREHEGLAAVNKGLDLLWRRNNHHEDDGLTIAAWTYYDICSTLNKKDEGLAVVHKAMNFIKEEHEGDCCHAAEMFGVNAKEHGLYDEARDMFEYSVSKRSTAEGSGSLEACNTAQELLKQIDREHPRK